MYKRQGRKLIRFIKWLCVRFVFNDICQKVKISIFVFCRLSEQNCCQELVISMSGSQISAGFSQIWRVSDIFQQQRCGCKDCPEPPCLCCKGKCFTMIKKNLHQTFEHLTVFGWMNWLAYIAKVNIFHQHFTIAVSLFGNIIGWEKSYKSPINKWYQTVKNTKGRGLV